MTRLKTDTGSDSPRLIDEAETDQKIADVLPDDLRTDQPEREYASLSCDGCGAGFGERQELYRQHVDRRKATGHCLGHIPEGAFVQTRIGDQILLVVGRGGGGGHHAG